MDFQSLIREARVTANRGRFHIFLGDPLSDGCDKTTVEPGNVFSPGVWTCGVSVWVESGGKWVGPEMLKDEEIEWSFVERAGGGPESVARYRAGVVAVESRLGHLGSEGSEGVDFCAVTFDGEARAAIVVKDVGPAGGKITKMAWDAAARTLMINGTIKVMVEGDVARCEIAAADAAFDSPAAAIEVRGVGVRFKVVHGFADRTYAERIPLVGMHAGKSVEKGLSHAGEAWKKALPARVYGPDERVGLAWERCGYHILAAMEGGMARIGAVNYPVFWMRDGVIVLRALDLMGRHDLARRGCEYLAPHHFSGGFGAESDAPGEGIWALVNHGLITRDAAWLERVFGQVEERVRWIERLRTAEKPLRALTENRIPFYWRTPGSSVLCLAAKEGLIQGRMDWHSPDFFINCWNAGGMRMAALGAEKVGRGELATAWRAEAEKYDELIATKLLPGYGNDRDPVIVPYPSGALSGYRAAVKDKLAGWMRGHRLSAEGARVPERLWTYFEAAQAHNAFLLGLREEAWKCLEGLLGRTTGSWDVGAYMEGEAGGNEFLPFANGEGRRGWLDEKGAMAGNMPHNWTGAEMINALRDVFVREEGDELVLGSGVPAGWVKAGAKFGVRRMPTALGEVSYEVVVGADGRGKMRYEGPGKWRGDFPCAVG